MSSPSQLAPGLPGSFPLPNSGNQGTAFAMQQSLHPMASAARGMTGGGKPAALAAAKK